MRVFAPPSKSRERGDERGGQRGRKQNKRSEFCCLPVSICLPVLILSHVLPERVARRENGLSEAITRCLFVKIKNPSFPGHAPGKDTLRAANAATKERFTGRKRVKRKRLPVVFPSFSERGSTGENARANAVSRRALSPVKIKFPVASADMRRHSDTLRAANAATKVGANGGENTRTSFLRSEGVCSSVIR